MIEQGTVGVTGMGCVCAPGNTIDDCMDSLFQERKRPLPPIRFTSGHTTTFPVFEIADDFESTRLHGETEVTRTARLALVCAYQALRDAGLDKVENLKNVRVGVCLGTTVGTAMNSESFYRQYLKNEQPDMKHITRLLNSNPSMVLAREFGISGPCQTVANACSSGTDAIGIAYNWIRSGLCDVVLAGGTDELCHVTYNGFISLMITDDGPCRPFDKDRKGLNLGEGAAVLILESERHMRARQKKAPGLYCRLRCFMRRLPFYCTPPRGAGTQAGNHCCGREE
ncbi:MAG TPA: beta-ketoacyl synthase N-terminal-like domain-containing protein [Syntrophorhabdaceae bacterium]|nr:beta-ketoacyl synthase N-terminal-like domain-containing protein [Syntrophorhabdaceae bacterium]